MFVLRFDVRSVKGKMGALVQVKLGNTALQSTQKNKARLTSKQHFVRMD